MPVYLSRTLQEDSKTVAWEGFRIQGLGFRGRRLLGAFPDMILPAGQ